MTSLSKSYRPDIDGLRGIAVFAVVAFHAGLPFFNGGFVGVDIFFVISGYLICSIIQREIAERRFSYVAFYARRAKRILPALFAVLLTCFIVATLVMTGAELNDFAKSAIANIAAVSNIYFWKSATYFATSAELKPLMMTWSLSVEEQFYLFFPPLLLLLSRFKWTATAPLIAMTALSLLASAWVTPRYPGGAFFLLPTRAWELGAGALLANYHSQHPVGLPTIPKWIREAMSVTGLAALAYSILSFTGNTAFPGLAAMVPVLGTVTLIALPGTVVNRAILSNRALVFVGLVSYSWYLWHWPLLSFARMVSDRHITLVTALTLATLSFLIAIASWRFIERPFRSTNSVDKVVLRRYGVATFGLLAIGIGLANGNGWQQRLPEPFLVIEQSGAHQDDSCMVSYGEARPNTGQTCIQSRPSGSIALLGDSHAAALGPALRELAAAKDIGYLQMTKASCPTLTTVTRVNPRQPQHARECAAFNQAVMEKILAAPDVRVVVLAGYWSSPFAEDSVDHVYQRTDSTAVPVSRAESLSNLRIGLQATIEQLKAAGKTVVLVRDVPLLDFDPVRTAATEGIPLRRTLATAFNVLPASIDGKVSNEHVVTDPTAGAIDALAIDVKVLSPAASLCPQNQCRYRDAKSLLYTDSQHLSTSGARIALQQSMFTALLDSVERDLAQQKIGHR